MNILGVSCGDHDPGAALVVDGELVAAAEEERFLREKHAVNRPPTRAARYCLELAGLRPADVDVVAYAFSPDHLRRLRWRYARRCWRHQRHRASDVMLRTRSHLAKRTASFRQLLTELGIDRERTRVEYVEHHLAHAASAFHASGFDEAAILTMDGVGELTCTLTARGTSDGIEKIHETLAPDSLGLFYSTITEFLGFETTGGEYKAMGMSAYGKPGRVDLSSLIRYRDGAVRVADDVVWVDRHLRHRGTRHSERLVEMLGPPRDDEGLTEPYVSIAAETQDLLERITLGIVDDHLAPVLERTRSLCFAGGCALNVRLNRKLLAHPLIERLYVQPASSDAGLGFGAAALVAEREGRRLAPMQHAYWGPAFSSEQIRAALEKLRVPHRRCDDPCRDGARLLAAGEVLGWVQGRMELGPRALGNRSILAHPAKSGISDDINTRIKFREPWRPFCPAILEEHAPAILGSDHPAPFMNLSYLVDAAWRERIPEVVHVDGSARAQTVSRATNPVFHELLTHFEQRTGLPVLLNTSLNRRGEPMACTPEDALATFFGSGLDHLMLGDRLVTKRPAEIAKLLGGTSADAPS